MFKKYFIFLIFLAALTAVLVFRQNIFSGLDKIRLSDQTITRLRLENEGLHQEVKDLQNKLNLESRLYLAARVYSRYPLNDNQSLIIDAGSKAGVKVGWPVLAGENYLLGKITKVKGDASEAMTIFSPDWKSSVRIGKGLPAQAGVDALLVGGNPPMLELIPGDAQISPGDEVLNVSPELPLNLYVGKISEIIVQPGISLKQAKLTTDYEPGKLEQVLLISDYEGL